ncbi:lantibiotic dehydratase [Algoriphagus boritolerans]|uniref:lantibiotic dehydratase n=1 Tax=Algoriphagus boritolerans TaxID=308111 RepID=UPI000A732E64
MSFLFRLPLIDFDPQDEAQIQKNWEWILRAIQYSSPSLLQEIGQVPFNLLKPELKNKIIKYLIRGRYRSTPFGLWAGVGLGDWGNFNYLKTPISYSSLQTYNGSKPGKKSTLLLSYKLAPGLIEYSDQVQYWSYCKKRRRVA